MRDRERRGVRVGRERERIKECKRKGGRERERQRECVFLCVEKT